MNGARWVCSWPRPEKPVDGRLAVRAVDPLAGRPPGELGGLGGLAQRGASAEQRVGVDAVVDGMVGDGHVVPFVVNAANGNQGQDIGTLMFRQGGGAGLPPLPGAPRCRRASAGSGHVNYRSTSSLVGQTRSPVGG